MSRNTGHNLTRKHGNEQKERLRRRGGGGGGGAGGGGAGGGGGGGEEEEEGNHLQILIVQLIRKLINAIVRGLALSLRQEQ